MSLCSFSNKSCVSLALQTEGECFQDNGLRRITLIGLIIIRNPFN